MPVGQVVEMSDGMQRSTRKAQHGPDRMLSSAELRHGVGRREVHEEAQTSQGSQKKGSPQEFIAYCERVRALFTRDGYRHYTKREVVASAKGGCPLCSAICS